MIHYLVVLHGKCRGVAKSFPSPCVNIFSFDKKVHRIFVILYKGKLNTKIT